jgi:hypothetical protein
VESVSLRSHKKAGSLKGPFELGEGDVYAVVLDAKVRGGISPEVRRKGGVPFAAYQGCCA